jgi:two-component system, NarL family, nitrate/nitrite response regulator NarL
LVLMGVRDGDNLGESLSAAKARFPVGHVVIVGNPRRREHVATAIASEATSFVDENVAAPTLIKHFELIAQGEPIISVLLLKRLLGNGSAPPPVETVPTREIDPQLSPREAAILKALTQGISNKVIAYQLQITEATVKVHVKAILRKIRVKNRTQAATWAVSQPTFAARPGNMDGGSLLSAVTLVAAPSP